MTVQDTSDIAMPAREASAARAMPSKRAWKSVQFPRLAVQAQMASPVPHPVPVLSYFIVATTYS